MNARDFVSKVSELAKRMGGTEDDVLDTALMLTERMLDAQEKGWYLGITDKHENLIWMKHTASRW